MPQCQAIVHYKQALRTKPNFSDRFNLGSAILTNPAKRQIEELAATFNQTMPSVIKVHGHTDSQAFKGVTSAVENDRLNLKLSQQRAEAVKRELVARDVLKVSGKGALGVLFFTIASTLLFL